jgi:hypothetical protein
VTASRSFGWALVALAVLLCWGLIATRAIACGSELWALKTATDPEAAQISISPRVTTITELSGFAVPHRRRGGRVTGEFQVWRLERVRIVQVRFERDGDIHLLLEQDGARMVAEIPDPQCVTGSRFESHIRYVRSEFLRRAWSAEGAIVTLDGIGFFDRLHGQEGAAPNGIELHPVLGIAW